jgi:iron-sulfur cluster assembly protein
MSVQDVSTEVTTVTLTATAAGKLEILKQEKQLDSSYALRVFVAGGGCSGLQYGMTFDDQVREGDSEFEQNGLRVLIDQVSMRYLHGASIDYIDSMMGGGFKIDNPNAVSSCGCGHSFRGKEGAEGESEGAAQGGGCGSCSSGGHSH